MLFPRWMYHKTEGGRIFQTAEELTDAGKGWESSPAAFEKHEESKSEIKELNLVAMNVAELKEILTGKGVSEKDLKGLKKDDLIAMIGNM